MDPYLGGAIASSLIGGIFGGSGSRSAQNRATRDARYTLQHMHGWRTHQARKEGLHPLVAWGGGGGGYSPPTAIGGDSMQTAMEGVSQAMMAKAAQRSDGKLRRKEEELIDAQIAEARSRTLLNSANARRAISGPMPSITGVTGGLEALDRLPSGQGRAVSDEPQRNMPARQRVTLGRHTATGPNPEAFEVGLSELMAGALIYGPQWLASAIANPNPQAGSKGRRDRRRRRSQ